MSVGYFDLFDGTGLAVGLLGIPVAPGCPDRRRHPDATTVDFDRPAGAADSLVHGQHPVAAYMQRDDVADGWRLNHVVVADSQSLRPVRTYDQFRRDLVGETRSARPSGTSGVSPDTPEPTSEQRAAKNESATVDVSKPDEAAATKDSRPDECR